MEPKPPSVHVLLRSPDPTHEHILGVYTTMRLAIDAGNNLRLHGWRIAEWHLDQKPRTP